MWKFLDTYALKIYKLIVLDKGTIGDIKGKHEFKCLPKKQNTRVVEVIYIANNRHLIGFWCVFG